MASFCGALKPVLVAGVVGFVTAAPAWPSAEAERLARSACYDCHSNETEWPLYSYVAPMSWLVRYDVDRGREALNLSRIDDANPGDAGKVVADGSMPPDRYARLHSDARLSSAERRVLVAALEAMEAADEGGNRGPGGGDERDGRDGGEPRGSGPGNSGADTD